MFLRLTCMAVAALSLGGTAARAASPVEGTWKSEDGEGIVEVAPCAAPAGAYCGRIVWIKQPRDADGKPVTDAKNPDAALQKRPVCGIEILSGMQPAADGSYAGGTIYDPEEGKSYRGSFTLDGTVLKVTGYVELPILGKLSDTDVWTRVTTPFERCK